jgi:transcription antitermination factor NusG
MQSSAVPLAAVSDLGALGWYAIYTRHQHEKRAAELLARKGFEVLLPLYQEAHQWKDRTQTVTLPVFPSYVFLRASLERKIDVLRTPGVCWFVGHGGRASCVSEPEINAIRIIAQRPCSIEPHPFLELGDRVIVKSGPFSGVEGILTRVKNQYRVVVSVELLQKAVAVEVDARSVRRTSYGTVSQAVGAE